MEKITFRFWDAASESSLLNQMFDIQFANVQILTPMTSQYEADKQKWLVQVAAGQARGQEIILMYVENTLAGYFAYRVEEDGLFIEEMAISPDYQRTLLFVRFIQFAGHFLPQNIRYMEALIRKENSASQTIAERLGMHVVGENPAGTDWRYRGDVTAIEKYLNHRRA